MNVVWAEGYQPELIAREIESAKSIDASGRLSFEAFTYKENIVLLYSTLVFPREIPESEGRRIVSQAVEKVGLQGAITAKDLIAEVNKLTFKYFQQQEKTYFLATSFSIHWSSKPPSLDTRGIQIRFERQWPRKYFTERQKLHDRATHILFAEPPNDYYPVRVRVKARSISEAAETALETVDLVRGIWNWYYNRRHFTRMSSGAPSPVNKIVLGPVHSLHQPSGSLATDSFWYEPNYRAPLTTFQFDDLQRLHKFYDTVQKGLRRSNYRPELENAIVRYTRALDDRDWNAAFLRLWGVLEQLTHSSKLSYDVTIKRAAFVVDEYEYWKQVLRHLRDYRNRLVHASANSVEIEAYMYQLKACVEALLQFHIGNKFGFNSLQEAGNFLDLPADSGELTSKHEELKARIRMTKYAHKFRNPKSK